MGKGVENASSSKKKRILSPEVRKYSSPTWAEDSPVEKVVKGCSSREKEVSKWCVSARRAETVAGERAEGRMR